MSHARASDFSIAWTSTKKIQSINHTACRFTLFISKLSRQRLLFSAKQKYESSRQFRLLTRCSRTTTTTFARVLCPIVLPSIRTTTLSVGSSLAVTPPPAPWGISSLFRYRCQVRRRARHNNAPKVPWTSSSYTSERSVLPRYHATVGHLSTRSPREACSSGCQTNGEGDGGMKGGAR